MAKDNFTYYFNDQFGYKILIPKDWKKKETDSQSKHLLVFSKGRYTEIKITAAKIDKKEQGMIDNWEAWYQKNDGKKLKKILTTKETAIAHNLSGQLMLFKSNLGKVNILQRVLIFKDNDALIIIECRAATSNFYKYTDVFNTVMGSYTLIDEFFRTENKLKDEPEVINTKNSAQKEKNEFIDQTTGESMIKVLESPQSQEKKSGDTKDKKPSADTDDETEKALKENAIEKIE